MEKIRERFNLELIVSLVIVMATVIGSTVPLYIHSSDQITAIQEEMKDFHGRLERQDAEFRGILAKQDAEFKSAMLLIEEKMRK